MFQNTNLSENLYSLGDLRFFIDSLMTVEHVNLVRQIDPSYTPNTSTPNNRTVVHTTSNTLFRLNIVMTLCEIVVPLNYNLFKHVLKDTVNFMISSIQTFTTPEIANALEFKMAFYVPNGSNPSQNDWWNSTGITQMGWTRLNEQFNKTCLGVPLNEQHVRYILKIHVDANYKLIKPPQQSNNTLNLGSNPSTWGTFANVPTIPAATSPSFTFKVPDIPITQPSFGNLGGFNTQQPIQPQQLSFGNPGNFNPQQTPQQTNQQQNTNTNLDGFSTFCSQPSFNNTPQNGGFGTQPTTPPLHPPVHRNQQTTQPLTRQNAQFNFGGNGWNFK